MSRPHENRVRLVVHVLPETEAKLRAEAVTAGTLGKVVDKWAKHPKRKPARS